MSEDLREENPFGASVPATRPGVLAQVAQQREVAEVQAALMIARANPRNELEAMDRILEACTRMGLADAATYEYARGGTSIVGPSIRLAECLAQHWGNMDFGIRELEQRDGESTVEAYAWDVQTNTRQRKIFQVPHVRFTREKSYRLNDPRDIYEHVANQGARRLRACILGVMPGDVVEAAVRQCERTLHSKMQVTPERTQSMMEKFAEVGVTQSMVEKRIQRRLDALTPGLMVQLGKMYNSLRDGMAQVSDFFPPEVQPAADDVDETQDIPGVGTSRTARVKDKLKKATAKPEKPAKRLERSELLQDLITMAEGASDSDAFDLVTDQARHLEEEEYAELRPFLEAARKRIAKQ